MPSSAELEAQVIRDCLDGREQQLYLRHKSGKSLSGLAAVYGRAYGGENGVREKLNELTVRIQSRLSLRAAGGDAVQQIAALARGDENDNSGGLPIRSVPAGTLNGRGAGREAESPVTSTPPIRPAPRPSSGGPSAGPSRNGLDAPAGSPAAARRGTQRTEAASRDRRVLALLMHRACSTMAVAAALELSNPQAARSCERLMRAGKVRRSEHYAFDWPGCRPGAKASRVWEASDGPSFVRVRAEAKGPKAPSETSTEPVPATIGQHIVHGPGPDGPAPAGSIPVDGRGPGMLSRADALAVVRAVRAGVLETCDAIIAILGG